MAVEVKLQQRLQQSLVLTPQLQQSLKMLQMGHLEYSEILSQELLENPTLEEVANPKEESFREESYDYSGNYSYSGNSSRGEFSPDNVPETATGLVSHLFMQIRTSDMSEREREFASHIVGNLNRDGYLETSVTVIAENLQVETEEIEAVLGVVQSLDPPGIAGRDLRECLLIQLEQLGLRTSLAWTLVEKHLGLLEARKGAEIAKLERVSQAEIIQALHIIRGLEPRPGRPFIDEPPVFIAPDVYVRRVGEEFVVTLNEGGVPRLKVNENITQMFGGVSSEEKQYIQERYRSAHWLIKNIELRQQTILRVARSIVDFQKEFFDQGVHCLKPLVLKDVAHELGLHESTISRVTSNKFMHTPHGIFEFKYFFRSGIRANGGELSSEAIKEQIRDLVEAEPAQSPLSDQEIVEALQAQGVSIARRTVAKYREAMNILPSAQRKRLY